MTIGRTKAEAVVQDVLAPKAVDDVLKALTSDKPLPFSIQTEFTTLSSPTSRRNKKICRKETAMPTLCTTQRSVLLTSSL